MSAVFAGDHRSLDDLVEILPFVIGQHAGQLSGAPVFASI